MNLVIIVAILILCVAISGVFITLYIMEKRKAPLEQSVAEKQLNSVTDKLMKTKNILSETKQSLQACSQEVQEKNQALDEKDNQSKAYKSKVANLVNEQICAGAKIPQTVGVYCVTGNCKGNAWLNSQYPTCYGGYFYTHHGNEEWCDHECHWKVPE